MGIVDDILDDHYKNQILADNIARAMKQHQVNQESSKTEQLYQCEYCKKEYLMLLIKCESCGGVVKKILNIQNKALIETEADRINRHSANTTPTNNFADSNVWILVLLLFIGFVIFLLYKFFNYLSIPTP